MVLRFSKLMGRKQNKCDLQQHWESGDHLIIGAYGAETEYNDRKCKMATASISQSKDEDYANRLVEYHVIIILILSGRHPTNLHWATFGFKPHNVC